MNEELEKVFERLKDSLESRKCADLRIVLLDMEPADIANFMEEMLNEKENVFPTSSQRTRVGRIYRNRHRYAGESDKSVYR